MEAGKSKEIADMLVWNMDFDEARNYLRNLPPEIKSGVMAELSAAASVISKIEKKFYSERGVSLALHADVD